MVKEISSPNPNKRRNSAGGGGINKCKQSENTNSIAVLCRFRPSRHQNDISKYFDVDSNSVTYQSEYSDRKSFTFDRIFGVETKQDEIFVQVESVIASVMSGFNGTILAYGQTNSGKSWTMEGVLDDPELRGVIPRAVDSLFESIAQSPVHMQFQLKMSYYEIYCEKVRDLLNPSQDNMKLREVRDEGFVIQDLTELYCGDKASVMHTIQRGKANRASAPTLMNAESSRSHSIVSIVLKQKDDSTGRSRTGRLFLVDLAGSEKVSKTGASGMRLEEAKNINGSLTTLGMVINALCDGATHVPYRDSKLTRLLMDSLGGNSRTSMIICCSPDPAHIPETLSTLRFGERAKRIENHAKVNEELSTAELQALLALARKEILVLKKKLATCVCGASVRLTDIEIQNANNSLLQSSGGAAATLMMSSSMSTKSDAMATYRSTLTLGDEEESVADSTAGVGSYTPMGSPAPASLMSLAHHHHHSTTGTTDAEFDRLVKSQLGDSNEGEVIDVLNNNSGGEGSKAITTAILPPPPPSSSSSIPSYSYSPVSSAPPSPFRIHPLDITGIARIAAASFTQEAHRASSLSSLPRTVLDLSAAGSVLSSPQDTERYSLLTPHHLMPSGSGGGVMGNNNNNNGNNSTSDNLCDNNEGGNFSSSNYSSTNDLFTSSQQQVLFPFSSSSSSSSSLPVEVLMARLRSSEQQREQQTRRAAQLEAEAESERMRAQDASEASLSLVAEATALRATIAELENRLLQAKMEYLHGASPRNGTTTTTSNRNSHSSVTQLHHNHNSSSRRSSFTTPSSRSAPVSPTSSGVISAGAGGSSTQVTTSTNTTTGGSMPSSPMNAAVEKHNSGDDVNSSSGSSSSSVDKKKTAHLTFATAADDEIIVTNNCDTNDTTEVTKKELCVIVTDADDTKAVNNKNADDDNNKIDHHNDDAHHKSNAEDDESESDADALTKAQSEEIRTLITQELKLIDGPLFRSRKTKKGDGENADITIEVLEDASSYAERSAQLREEYEMYLQRLMVKLVEEQQNRARVEEKLEDVLKQLWRVSGQQQQHQQEQEQQSRKRRHSTSGIFRLNILAMLGLATTSTTNNNTSRSMKGATGNSNIADDSGNNQQQLPMSPRMLGLMHSLELAQSKSAQISSELETCKEAHSIVLETKDAMMRSLVKQNSVLVREHEEESQRTEALETKVQQLQLLLRAAITDTSVSASNNNNVTNVSVRGTSTTNAAATFMSTMKPTTDAAVTTTSTAATHDNSGASAASRRTSTRAMNIRPRGVAVAVAGGAYSLDDDNSSDKGNSSANNTNNDNDNGKDTIINGGGGGKSGTGSIAKIIEF